MKNSKKCLTLVAVIALSALIAVGCIACSQSKTSEEPETTTAALTESSPVQETAAETTSAEWLTSYQESLQKILDQGTYITGVWINDVDGDGVPMVALSTIDAIHKIPNVILNYKDGHFIVKDDIHNDGTGGVVDNEACFVKGTDYLILRVQGRSQGTWPANQLDIFDITDKGYTYENILSKSVATDDLEQEAEKDDPESENYLKYIETISKRMDKEVEDKIGKDHAVINYADQMKPFDIVIGENSIATNMRDPVDYLEKELGISLTLDEQKYPD